MVSNDPQFDVSAGLTSIRLRAIKFAALLASALLCVTAGANPGDDCNAQSFQRVLQPAALSIPAQAVWLNRQSLVWPGLVGPEAETDVFRLVYANRGTLRVAIGATIAGADGALTLMPGTSVLSETLKTRFNYVPSGARFDVASADLNKIPALLTAQVVLVREDQRGKVVQMTRVQVAGALDDLYQAAAQVSDLGVTVAVDHPQTVFNIWAPTAQKVAVCIYPTGRSAASQILTLARNASTGVWTSQSKHNLSGQYYRYLVDVFVPGIGLLRNRVTDPYSVSLNADSQRSYITRLDASDTEPAGWHTDAAPDKVKVSTDMNVYELHVRDFSINDDSVSSKHRGKYLAFTEFNSNGMQHLAALAKAGITDIHLLPVFDFASVPEHHCRTPQIDPNWPADSLRQQAAAMLVAETDCFNWGYDPYHYSAPEGSYATDPEAGAVRVRELRSMVAALHQTGLRAGMDVVYNHTFISGQNEKSVLDRIVPGYYHRLNADGVIERSTCCDNTATENLMMGKLLTDSVLHWAIQYHIDSFRFDLMAHQPRALMERLQRQLLSQTGRRIQLIGEGWNFGEVENGARFVQASQLSLSGSGIGTFNDRLRDAVRGGRSGDAGADLIRRKGYINGATGLELLRAADLVRVGLAGSVRDYSLLTHDGKCTLLADIDYNGQPAGYASQPAEVVNYVENHDNQTLFDINAYKLPPDTAPIDRARVQMLGAALVALSQGVAYYHAGIDILRSKSMDANSFNSGDWFNRLDWRYHDNYFGTGLPPAPDNAKNYAWIAPLLSNPMVRPGTDEIRLSRDLFRDLIRIRSSSSLFHLVSADEIRQRLVFENVGIGQIGSLMVGHLDGTHYPGAGFAAVLYLVNVSNSPQQIVLDQEKNRQYVLHPVQSSAYAADQRIAKEARYEPASGKFTVPPVSAVVFVEPL